jgi:radical SAM superfamily enzyme YgiQ (UPF0313 family)
MVPQLKSWQAPNLALSSITGNVLASQPHHEVHMADLILVRDSLTESIKKLLKDFRPDLVGLTAMSFQFATARRIAAYIKSLDNDIKTVLGGYHATLMYDEITREGKALNPPQADSGQAGEAENFDFILRGESDQSFGELLQALEGRRSLGTIRGLSFKENSHWVHNSPRPLEDLRKVAPPNRTNRVFKGYVFGLHSLDIIETSRGCTMPCNFCSMSHMYGQSFRTYELERVMDDIATAKRQGARYLAISDDNICLDVKRMEELCDAIIRAGHNDIAYVVQASSIGMSSSETLIEKMARAGFEVVFLGIENVSERNLRLMKKGNIVERTKRAIELLHKYNMLIVGGMIIGHPEDREEDIAQNYEFFDKMDVDFYSDQIITPYPKTGMREELLRQGLITNLYDYSKYNGFWANVRTKHLDSQELQFIKWKYRRRYSTFYKTTKTFKSRFPLGWLLRVFALRPYYSARDLITQWGMSEKEIFKAEMEAFEHLNDFPELPGGTTEIPEAPIPKSEVLTN